MPYFSFSKLKQIWCLLRDHPHKYRALKKLTDRYEIFYCSYCGQIISIIDNESEGF